MNPIEFPLTREYRTANCYACVVRNDGGEDPIGACERCGVVRAMANGSWKE